MQRVLLVLQIARHAISASASDAADQLTLLSTAVRNRFCVHVSGVRDAECLDDICVSPTETVGVRLCDEGTLESYAAEFERIRGLIWRAASSREINRGLFDCARQLLTSDYPEFLMTRNSNRLIRNDGSDTLFKSLGSSAESMVALTQLYLRVPGSNWVITENYDSVVEWTIPHLVSYLFPPGGPSEILFTRRIMERHSSFDIASVIMEFISTQTHQRLLLAWALSTAKSVARFTDDEVDAYSKVLLRGFHDIERMVESNPDSVPGEIVHWLYTLISRSSILLQTPLMRSLQLQYLHDSNARVPNIDDLIAVDPHWFTRPLVSALPGIRWEDPVTNEEFIGLATAFSSLERREDQMPPAIIKMRILYAMAKVHGYETTRVFTIIPPVWRDFAILFVPKPHHFLDGLVSVLSELATAPHLAVHPLIVGCRLLHQLGLEDIEANSQALRVTSASRAPHWPHGFSNTHFYGSSRELIRNQISASLASSLQNLRAPAEQILAPIGEP